MNNLPYFLFHLTLQSLILFAEFLQSLNPHNNRVKNRLKVFCLLLSPLNRQR